jgi:hypothetical protein
MAFLDLFCYCSRYANDSAVTSCRTPFSLSRVHRWLVSQIMFSTD